MILVQSVRKTLFNISLREVNIMLIGILRGFMKKKNMFGVAFIVLLSCRYAFSMNQSISLDNKKFKNSGSIIQDFSLFTPIICDDVKSLIKNSYNEYFLNNSGYPEVNFKEMCRAAGLIRPLNFKEIRERKLLVKKVTSILKWRKNMLEDFWRRVAEEKASYAGRNEFFFEELWVERLSENIYSNNLTFNEHEEIVNQKLRFLLNIKTYTPSLAIQCSINDIAERQWFCPDVDPSVAAEYIVKKFWNKYTGKF